MLYSKYYQFILVLYHILHVFRTQEIYSIKKKVVVRMIRLYYNIHKTHGDGPFETHGDGPFVFIKQAVFHDSDVQSCQPVDLANRIACCFHHKRTVCVMNCFADKAAVSINKV